MKLAILSDIHSNIYALEAVLKDAKNNNVDLIVNTGDSFYGPIEPRRTYEALISNKVINTCGNQDREILEASLEQLEQNPTLRYVYEDLKEEVLYFIQDLPFDKYLDDEIYVVHGTKNDDSVYLLEDIKNKEVSPRDEKKIIELLDEVESKFIICGHSHTARCINLSNGQVIINPGSVGLQAYKDDLPNEHKIENNFSEATYVILDIKEDKYNIELKKIPYDVEKAALKAIENGREDWAYALRTGRVADFK